MAKIGVEPLKDGDDKSGKLRLLIDKLYEHHILGNSKRVEEPKEEKDDYDPERYYCDCPYGTYLKEENLVYCTCTYPSVVRWLPKNRKVLPKVCDDHLPRLQALEDFVEKKRGSAPPETTEQNKTFYCALKNGLIPRSQAPCKDIYFKCPNVNCLAEVRAGRYPQLRKPQPSKKKAKGDA